MAVNQNATTNRILNKLAWAIDNIAATVDAPASGDVILGYDDSAGTIKKYPSPALTETIIAADVLTAAESGKTIILSSTAGRQITLPLVAAGLKFTFIGGTSEVTSTNHTIISNAAETNNMFGAVSAGGIVVLIDTHDTLTLVADKWLAGDRLEFFSDGTNWYVSGVMGVTVGITSA